MGSSDLKVGLEELMIEEQYFGLMVGSVCTEANYETV